MLFDVTQTSSVIPPFLGLPHEKHDLFCVLFEQGYIIIAMGATRIHQYVSLVEKTKKNRFVTNKFYSFELCGCVYNGSKLNNRRFLKKNCITAHV